MRDIIEKIEKEISGESIKKTAGEINRFDRWFSFSKFHQSARLCQNKMEEVGLKSVGIFTFPADGRTRIGGYIIPRAWDAGDALANS